MLNHFDQYWEDTSTALCTEDHSGPAFLCCFAALNFVIGAVHYDSKSSLDAQSLSDSSCTTILLPLKVAFRECQRILFCMRQPCLAVPLTQALFLVVCCLEVRSALDEVRKLA